MRKTVVDELVKAFPFYADYILLEMPDERLSQINELFCDIRDVQKQSPEYRPGDRYMQMAAVVWDAEFNVYVRPMPGMTWTNEMALSLVQAVNRYNFSLKLGSCEICGRPGLKWKIWTGHDRYLCDEHSKGMNDEA